MKKVAQMNIKDKIKDFSMLYNIEEIHDCLHNLTEQNSGVFSHDKRAWFPKNERPKLIKDIESQLRTAFRVNENTECVVCIYYPPTNKSNKLLIKDKNPNVLNRVIISTVNELATLEFQSASDQLYFKNFTAYALPEMTASCLSISFDNSKIIKLPARKGHRSKKITKNIDNRYIIVVD